MISLIRIYCYQALIVLVITLLLHKYSVKYLVWIDFILTRILSIWLRMTKDGIFYFRSATPGS